MATEATTKCPPTAELERLVRGRLTEARSAALSEHVGLCGACQERLESLWLRGGFPESLLAESDAASLRWRVDFIRTYLERDIPQLGPRIPAETLRRLWTMLAHQQGGLLNASALARALAVAGAPAVARRDRQASARRAGKPPVATGPQRVIVRRTSDLPCVTIAARYSSQSGCSPLIDR